MDYTDEEIEMLARFDCEGCGVRWDIISDTAKAHNVSMIHGALVLAVADPEYNRVILAAAHLMREARERGRGEDEREVAEVSAGIEEALRKQHASECENYIKLIEQSYRRGAEEMRERAALVADGVSRNGPYAAAAIRGLPLPGDPNGPV